MKFWKKIQIIVGVKIKRNHSTCNQALEIQEKDAENAFKRNANTAKSTYI
jgi:hypothetical protein